VALSFPAQSFVNKITLLPLFAYSIQFVFVTSRLPYLRSCFALVSCDASLSITRLRSGPLPPGSGLFLSGHEGAVSADAYSLLVD
jgi:hypothetical protein